MRFGSVFLLVVAPAVAVVAGTVPVKGDSIEKMSLPEACMIYAPSAVFVRGDKQAEAFRLVAELITIDRSRAEGRCFCATREMKWPEILQESGTYRAFIPDLKDDGTGEVSDDQLMTLKDMVAAGVDQKSAYCGGE